MLIYGIVCLYLPNLSASHVVQQLTEKARSQVLVSHLYIVYSFGGADRGSLPFILPKFPIQSTVSLKMTMADRAGRLKGSTICLKTESTWVDHRILRLTLFTLHSRHSQIMQLYAARDLWGSLGHIRGSSLCLSRFTKAGCLPLICSPTSLLSLGRGSQDGARDAAYLLQRQLQAWDGMAQRRRLREAWAHPLCHGTASCAFIYKTKRR